MERDAGGGNHSEPPKLLRLRPLDKIGDALTSNVTRGFVTRLIFPLALDLASSAITKK